MLFLYTATIVAHPTYDRDVVQALAKLMNRAKGPFREFTPVRLIQQSHVSLVMIDALLAHEETAGEIARQRVRQVHPATERRPGGRPQGAAIAELLRAEPVFLARAATAFWDAGKSVEEIATELLKADAARWLPEINVSLISNMPESAAAALAYWQRLPHNSHHAATL